MHDEVELQDIETREDIYTLVKQFYSRAREHEVLGPIFNRSISDWEPHFQKITDFWESQLLFTKRFRGNPLEAHIKVDRQENHGLSNEMFGFWLNLWFQTIDELYTGEIAERAKHNARKLSVFMFLKIWEARKVSNQ